MHGPINLRFTCKISLINLLLIPTHVLWNVVIKNYVVLLELQISYDCWFILGLVSIGDILEYKLKKRKLWMTSVILRRCMKTRWVQTLVILKTSHCDKRELCLVCIRAGTLGKTKGWICGPFSCKQHIPTDVNITRATILFSLYATRSRVMCVIMTQWCMEVIGARRTQKRLRMRPSVCRPKHAIKSYYISACDQ